MKEPSLDQRVTQESVSLFERAGALIDERIGDIKLRLEALPSGDSVISALQDEILKIVNELRVVMGIETSNDFNGPDLAGFTMGDEDYGPGGPNVTSFITSEIVGHMEGNTEGSFVVDDILALKRALQALCCK